MAEHDTSLARPDALLTRLASSERARLVRARLRHMRRRLQSRRWLTLIVGLLLLALMALGGLAPEWAGVAFVVFAFATAVVSAADMSEAPRKRTAFRSARSREPEIIHAALEALPDPAMLLSRAGRIISLNSHASDFIPRARPGTDIATVIRNPEFLETLGRVRSDRTSMTIEYSERVPVERHIAATLARLETDASTSGAPRVVVTFRDLSEQARLNQMRSDFIAYASHELRTPLSSLQGFIETLQGAARDDPENRERFLKVMSAEAGRMTRLIDDLLSLSRVEMNQHVFPSGTVEINHTVRHVVETLEPLAADSGVALSFAPAEGEACVRGDLDELVQVLQNLILNAIKYGGDGGRVDVRASRCGSGSGRSDGRGEIRVSVRDYGPGIAEQHLPRLTERFYRVDAASSRKKGGTGLGLAIVKHIVNRHRGELEIASKPGEGAEFAVRLAERACE